VADLSEILKIALTLDIEDRAVLAERLLASLDDVSEPEAERLWAQEAQRRLEAYRSGFSEAVSAEEVATKARKLFR